MRALKPALDKAVDAELGGEDWGVAEGFFEEGAREVGAGGHTP